ncbi:MULTISPECIES: hypothetical protein [unclassified Pseudomonas]|uniref:hypothetical protein n=1 Tax=unclassified Pseudomonas TaxID=196821 RepID=UPI00200C2474|nr:MULTISPECIES: hypothetical protein [unclassified Pseudomonas]
MRGKYKAAFIVPNGTAKTLGDYGWEFRGVGRISTEVITYLVGALGLKLVGEYSGIRKYVGEHAEMSTFLDEGNAVESIYFQFYNDSIPDLSGMFKESDFFQGWNYSFLMA